MDSTSGNQKLWNGGYSKVTKNFRGFRIVWLLRILAALIPLMSSSCGGGVEAHKSKNKLQSQYYYSSCPNLESIVLDGIKKALVTDPRIGASLLRLHFHDCFVDGCDGSLLIDDTATFQGEQSAIPNRNSARGFEVIDDIKASVEAACPNTVSCSDILAITARDGVVLAGGPSWDVTLGRYDGFTSNVTAANLGIPAPFFNFSTLVAVFSQNGLSQTDLVALSGSHTIGFGHCNVVNVIGNSRLYNWSANSDTDSGTALPDPHMDPNFLAFLQSTCSPNNSPNTLIGMDPFSIFTFDNSYFKNLLINRGLFSSDQTLEYSSTFSASIVSEYASDQSSFFDAFAAAMIKMGSIGIKTSANGEIRKQCGVPNSGPLG